MTHRGQRGFLWSILVLLVLAVALFSSKRWVFPRSGAELPVFGTIPQFSLVDQEGRPVARQDLLGKTWIADFIFTRCLGPCPVMTNTLSELQDEIPPEVTFVSFSLDPTYDTPEKLKEYGERFEADLERWIFLTGEPETVFSIPKTLKLIAEADTDTIIHSSRYLLIDPEGRVRGWYPVVDLAFETDQTELERMRQDVRRLLGSL
jgi:protein SCO1/2